MQVSAQLTSHFISSSQSLMKRPNRDDTSLYGLTNLLSQLQKEYKLSVRVRTASTEIVPGVIQPSQDVQIPPTLRPSVKARGLPLFDRATHLVENIVRLFYSL